MKKERLSSGILRSCVNLSDMVVDVFSVWIHQNLGFSEFVSFFTLCIMTVESRWSFFVYEN